MDSRVEVASTETGAKVEIATVLHDGKEFTAMGSVVDHKAGRVTGYPKGNVLQTWDGKPIGTCTVTSTWRLRVFAGPLTMRQYHATVDGIHYTGRGQGDGMCLNLRRCK